MRLVGGSFVLVGVLALALRVAAPDALPPLPPVVALLGIAFGLWLVAAARRAAPLPPATRVRLLAILAAALAGSGAVGLAGVDTGARPALDFAAAAACAGAALWIRRKPPTSAGLLVLLFLVPALGPGCGPEPLRPRAGVPEYQADALVPVPGGRVNVLDGNFLVAPEPLVFRTAVGPHAVGAVRNGADGVWRFSFEMRLEGGVFVDALGTAHDAAGPMGAPIAGTRWVREGASAIATKGGLVHVFSGPRLERIHLRGHPWPALRFVWSGDELARVEQCEDAAACITLYTASYQGGRPAAITDHSGRRAEYVFAGSELVAARSAFEVAEGLPGTRFEYAAGRLAAQVSGDGVRSEYAWDGAGRLREARFVGHGSPVWSLAYAVRGDGFVTTLTDPLSHRTEHAFDAQRRLGRMTQLDVGESVTFAWTGLRPTRLTLPDGTSGAFTWTDDAPSEIVTASGNRIRIAYERTALAPGAGDGWAVRTVTDSLGPVSETLYDADGDPVEQRNGLGETTRIEATGLRLDALTTPAGVRTELSGYGLHGRPAERRTGPATVRDVLDARGNRAVGVDDDVDTGYMLSGIRRRDFDAADRPARLVQEHEPIVLAYRADGQLRRVQRANGAATEYDYDGLGRLVARRDKVDGAWETTTYTRDALGRVGCMRRANGMEQCFTYDAAGRVVRRRWLRHGVEEHRLDLVYQGGRLVRKLDSAHGAPETYAYDAAGRVRDVTFPGGEGTTFAYDVRGRPVAIVYWLDGAPLRAFTTTWDLADRRTAVFDGGHEIASVRYAGGRAEEVRYGNGLRTRTSFDPQTGLPTGTQVLRGDAPVAGSALTHTGYGNPDAVAGAAYAVLHWAEGSFGPHTYLQSFEQFSTLLLGGYPETYGPGVAHGAVWHTAFGWAETGGASHQYATDGLGNYAERVASLPSAAIGDEVRQVRERNPEGNRLRAIRRWRVASVHPGGGVAATSESVEAYAFDEAGFCTLRRGRQIAWTAHGRPRRIGADTAEWDAEGRLRALHSAGFTARFRYGGAVVADAAGNPLTIDLGFVQVRLADGRRSYRHLDPRGNVKMVSDDDGVLRQFTYYRNANRWKTLGAADPPDPRSFAGGLELGDDLLQIGERLYDNDAEQFLQPDPLDWVRSGFAYAGLRAHLYVDRTGAKEAIGFALDGAGAVGSRLGGLAGAGAGAVAGAAAGGVLGGLVGGAVGGWLGAKMGGWFAQAAVLTVYGLLGGDVLEARGRYTDGGPFGPAGLDLFPSGDAAAPASFALLGGPSGIDTLMRELWRENGSRFPPRPFRGLPGPSWSPGAAAGGCGGEAGPPPASPRCAGAALALAALLALRAREGSARRR